MCLPSEAVLQHLPSYLGFSYLGHGVSLHGCSSKAQPLLLTLDKGYLLNAALPDLQCGIAPLSPPAPAQPPLRVTPLVAAPGLGGGLLLPATAPGLGRGDVGSFSLPSPLVSSLGAWGISSWLPPLTSDSGYLLSAAPPDLGHGVAPPGHSCAVAVWYSRPLPLTSDVG